MIGYGNVSIKVCLVLRLKKKKKDEKRSIMSTKIRFFKMERIKIINAYNLYAFLTYINYKSSVQNFNIKPATFSKNLFLKNVRKMIVMLAMSQKSVLRYHKLSQY